MERGFPKLSFIIVLLTVSLCGFVSFGSVSELETRLNKATEGIGIDYGIGVVSLDKKELLFEKWIEKPLNPASVTKLITTAAALKYLGPDHRFPTYFYKIGEDLFVRGEGDPSLVVEDMKEIVWELKGRGVCNIRNIVFDDSFFADYAQPGLEKGPPEFYTGALSLNFNRVNAKIVGRTKGVIDLILDAGEGVEIEAEKKLIALGRRGRAVVTMKAFEDKRGWHFLVSGSVPSSVREFELKAELPSLYFSLALASLLKSSGCLVSGGIYEGLAPQGARPVFVHYSKPISSIIADMNKFSNNMIADQLVKYMGARLIGAPGTIEKGISILKRYLSSIGVSKDSILVNGSGLSYQTRVSPIAFLTVIYDMYRNKGLWGPFYDSLSIAGHDGTMRHRYRYTELDGILRAKTGTVAGVRAIAGVVPSRSGEMLAYVVILNGSGAAGKKDIMDEVAHAAFEFTRGR